MPTDVLARRWYLDRIHVCGDGSVVWTVVQSAVTARPSVLGARIRRARELFGQVPADDDGASTK
jgi:hypothetical protein